MELKEINQEYERIMHRKDLSDYEKAQLYARLMTKMEGAYSIPMLRNPKWEEKNKKVIALYRKISLSRSFDD